MALLLLRALLLHGWCRPALLLLLLLLRCCTFWRTVLWSLLRRCSLCTDSSTRGIHSGETVLGFPLLPGWAAGACSGSSSSCSSNCLLLRPSGCWCTCWRDAPARWYTFLAKLLLLLLLPLLSLSMSYQLFQLLLVGLQLRDLHSRRLLAP
jgi:hypothetical protein